MFQFSLLLVCGRFDGVFKNKRVSFRDFLDFDRLFLIFKSVSYVTSGRFQPDHCSKSHRLHPRLDTHLFELGPDNVTKIKGV
jgi:hypothetical protein